MPFLIKTNGGPVPGVHVVPPGVMEWPFPDILPFPGVEGHYRKVRQSNLDPADAEQPHVGVGAEYDWIDVKSN